MKLARLTTLAAYLAGALALEHAEIDAGFGQTLRTLLDQYVTKPNERALFGLSEAANSNNE